MDITSYPSFFRHEYLTNLTEDQSLMVHVLNTSEHFDRYMKSSYIDYLNNDYYDEPNPFAQTVATYSNVTNGIGIFAAYAATIIHIEDHPCN